VSALFRRQFSSSTTVVVVLSVILLVQVQISYSLTIGKLAALDAAGDWVIGVWIGVRFLALAFVILMRIMDRKDALFKGMILANALFTLGLLANVFALSTVLAGMTQQSAQVLLRDAFFVALANILIFSIWYWIIDPPGIGEAPRTDAAWDFLFPQRAAELPQFAGWRPRYGDYLFLAFTTTLAFSPAETGPLTIRAKLLMILQASISVVTIVVIVGNAINVL
jgi:hypothetical protein